MAATVTGTVDTLKRLFENGLDSSKPFVSKGNEYYNRSSENSSGNSDSNNKIEITQPKPFLNGSFHPFSNSPSSFNQVLYKRNSVELTRTNPVPPKVKPKPLIYRKIVPVLKNEPSFKTEQASISKESTNISTEQKAEILPFENAEIAPRISNSAMEIRPKPSISPTNSDKSQEVFYPKQKLSSSSALPPNPVPTQLSVPKKPPPVLKKPRSVLSGHDNHNSNGQHHSSYQYDRALEEQFGLKVDDSAYDFVESWANYQAQTQIEFLKNKTKRNGFTNDNTLPQNGTVVNFSRSPSVSSSTGMSGSNFTNSSIRSILKKGRPSLAVEKKRLTFKDDDHLITKYNYPSEDSYDETDSLDHFNSALGSDTDDDDDAQEYELEVVRSVSTLRSSGSRRSEAKLILTPSNASTISSSTLKGSIIRQPRLPISHASPLIRYSSSERSQNGRNRSHNSNFNGHKTPKATIPSNWTNGFTSNPIFLTPSKSDGNSNFKRFKNGLQFHY